MISKTFKYTSYTNLEVEREIFFNISEIEYYDKEFSTEGGWIGKMKEALDAKNLPAMWGYFKDLILSSVGKISDDGESFVKSPEYTKWFTETPMYNQLLLSFFNGKKGQEEGIAFIRGVFPAAAQKKIAEEFAKEAAEPVDQAEL